MNKCDRCGDYRLFSAAGCNCEEYLVDHEYGPSTIWAFSFEAAAEAFATKYNDEGDLMNDSIEVEVTHGGEVKKFEVSAEPDIYYNVHEL